MCHLPDSQRRMRRVQTTARAILRVHVVQGGNILQFDGPGIDKHGSRQDSLVGEEEVWDGFLV